MLAPIAAIDAPMSHVGGEEFELEEFELEELEELKENCSARRFDVMRTWPEGEGRDMVGRAGVGRDEVEAKREMMCEVGERKL